MKKKRKYTKRAVKSNLVTAEIHGIGIDLSLSITNDTLAELVSRSLARVQGEMKPMVQTAALGDFILSLAPTQVETIGAVLNAAQKKLWFEAIQNLVPQANDPIPVTPSESAATNHTESA